jgi:hypothetical protein
VEAARKRVTRKQQHERVILRLKVTFEPARGKGKLLIAFNAKGILLDESQFDRTDPG